LNKTTGLFAMKRRSDGFHAQINIEPLNVPVTLGEVTDRHRMIIIFRLPADLVRSGRGAQRQGGIGTDHPKTPAMTDWSQIVQQRGQMVWNTVFRLVNHEADAVI
jgi:hypothetical protein